MPYARRGGSNEANNRDKNLELAVILGGEYAGTLSVYKLGYASFAYDEAYHGPSLSVRMPVKGELYLDDVVLPWVEGLLPDNDAVRESMAREAGLSSQSPYNLLARYGKDCPGAVQICPVDEVEKVIATGGALEPLSDEAIGRRLRAAQASTSPQWVVGDEGWSLGGAQGKVALARSGMFGMRVLVRQLRHTFLSLVLRDSRCRHSTNTCA